MKILPIYQNTPTVMYGAFMEGNLPNPLNYDMQTVLNNMLSGRAFIQTQIGGGQHSLVPNTTSLQSSPAPAWTTVQGYRGKRVLPKVTFASYSTVYQDLVDTGIASAQYQLDMLFATILWHRCASTTSAIQMPCTAPNSGASVPTVKNKNAEGSWTLAEYDFGADVVINALTSITQTTANNNLFANTSANLLFLQVQQGSSWVDVTNLVTNLFQTSGNFEKYYQLPATVQGRRFRIVSKAATNPFFIGVGTFALHFYGDYAAGSAPRTLGKVQHVVMFPHGFGTAYGIPAMSQAMNVNSYGRWFPHYGLTITDDVKQASSYDLLIADATAYPGQEQTVGSFTVSYTPISLETY
ncbi:hypothetical protein pEaSNUABM28_00084 [Erwinia phage pEa_SNUABM_28]|uniref:Uncharacterized protein n=1 Tax=Erwinia phage pEa_SNUABM_16 TaxID=2869544 RepID=A0AAE8XQ14_9CAUD|nr:hypothetical protein MPK64_gp082 [Erwinia phage pEa_SNUABM_16]QZE58641.1 hypothetical protein pEaSNUABM28_00084 [Erwinia phage pEa_SNUABM_28]QZE58985.1 hypothetical protein pEaSNUABM18_00082 [Erwinia phage pEa_SNUABM_18]UAW96226.1 hypothetical protein pEaSNUABM16_00082 [Erwinia phage pEa_SNUABM_16]